MMKRPQKRVAPFFCRSAAGSTLAELLIALALMATVILPMIQISDQAIRGSRENSGLAKIYLDTQQLFVQMQKDLESATKIENVGGTGTPEARQQRANQGLVFTTLQQNMENGQFVLMRMGYRFIQDANHPQPNRWMIQKCVGDCNLATNANWNNFLPFDSGTRLDGSVAFLDDTLAGSPPRFFYYCNRPPVQKHRQTYNAATLAGECDLRHQQLDRANRVILANLRFVENSTSTVEIPLIETRLKHHDTLDAYAPLSQNANRVEMASSSPESSTTLNLPASDIQDFYYDAERNQFLVVGKDTASNPGVFCVNLLGVSTCPPQISKKQKIFKETVDKILEVYEAKVNDIKDHERTEKRSNIPHEYHFGFYDVFKPQMASLIEKDCPDIAFPECWPQALDGIIKLSEHPTQLPGTSGWWNIPLSFPQTPLSFPQYNSEIADERLEPGFLLKNGATMTGFIGSATNNAIVVDWNGSLGPNVIGQDQLYLYFDYNNASYRDNIAKINPVNQALWDAIRDTSNKDLHNITMDPKTRTVYSTEGENRLVELGHWDPFSPLLAATGGLINTQSAILSNTRIEGLSYEPITDSLLTVERSNNQSVLRQYSKNLGPTTTALRSTLLKNIAGIPENIRAVSVEALPKGAHQGYMASAQTRPTPSVLILDSQVRSGLLNVYLIDLVPEWDNTLKQFRLGANALRRTYQIHINPSTGQVGLNPGIPAANLGKVAMRYNPANNHLFLMAENTATSQTTVYEMRLPGVN